MADRFARSSSTHLLRWAARYLVEWADALERAHRDPFTERVNPAETRAEIADLRSWARRAAAFTGGNGQKRVPRSCGE